MSSVHGVKSSFRSSPYGFSLSTYLLWHIHRLFPILQFSVSQLIMWEQLIAMEISLSTWRFFINPLEILLASIVSHIWQTFTKGLQNGWMIDGWVPVVPFKAKIVFSHSWWQGAWFTFLKILGQMEVSFKYLY